MKQITTLIDKILAPALIALMAIMVLAVTWQVLSRYLFRAPSSYTEEIARFMLIWIGVLGAAYAYRSKMHLGLDLLVNHLQGKSRIAAELASTFFVAAFAIVVMLVGGSLLVQLTWELNQESAAIGIKMAYIYSCIPLSGAIIMLYAIDAACDTLFQPSRSEDQ